MGGRRDQTGSVFAARHWRAVPAVLHPRPLFRAIGLESMRSKLGCLHAPACGASLPRSSNPLPSPPSLCPDSISAPSRCHYPMEGVEASAAQQNPAGAAAPPARNRRRGRAVTAAAAAAAVAAAAGRGGRGRSALAGRGRGRKRAREPDPPPPPEESESESVEHGSDGGEHGSEDASSREAGADADEQEDVGAAGAGHPPPPQLSVREQAIRLLMHSTSVQRERWECVPHDATQASQFARARGCGCLQVLVLARLTAVPGCLPCACTPFACSLQG